MDERVLSCRMNDKDKLVTLPLPSVQFAKAKCSYHREAKRQAQTYRHADRQTHMMHNHNIAGVVQMHVICRPQYNSMSIAQCKLSGSFFGSNC